MNNLPTVSDTKRAFYNIHTRPVNSIYRRVVEELMVEMHLLRVNADFQEDAIFALGVVTTYDRFMEGYTPAEDRDAIFAAICRAQETDPEHYRHQGERLRQFAQSQSEDSLMEWLTQASTQGGDDLQGQIHAIAHNPKFKYSRLFGVGLLSLLEAANSELLKDTDKLTKTLQSVAELLHLPESKFQRDAELYCSNLEKMIQTRQAMEDIVAAERKRRQKAETAKKTQSDSDLPEITDGANDAAPESTTESETPTS